MSEYERHKGTIERVYFEGSIEDFAVKVVRKELPDYYGDWNEFFRDNFREYGYYIYKDTIFKINNEECEASSDIFEYRKITDNKIEYHFSFYNGGTGLDEQIEEVLEQIEETEWSEDDLVFKEDVESVTYSDDFWYALRNGYIDLDILEDNNAKQKLIDAISIVEDFQYQLESQDFFEEM